jgi:hypothetical protein
MRSSAVTPAVLIAAFAAATTVVTSQDRVVAPKGPPLIQDYIAFSVTAPPPALELDPFYKKYVDAHGIPVVTSAKVPDAALLMARDIVQFMLANRPDLRKELIRKKWKLAIMAQTEVTYDIPEHRKFRLLPKIEDERLTAESLTARTRRRAPRRTCWATRARATLAARSACTSSRTASCAVRSIRSIQSTERRLRTRTRRRRRKGSRRRRGIQAITSTSIGPPASRRTCLEADAGRTRCWLQIRGSTSSSDR